MFNRFFLLGMWLCLGACHAETLEDKLQQQSVREAIFSKDFVRNGEEMEFLTSLWELSFNEHLKQERREFFWVALSDIVNGRAYFFDLNEEEKNTIYKELDVFLEKLKKKNLSAIQTEALSWLIDRNIRRKKNMGKSYTPYVEGM